MSEVSRTVVIVGTNHRKDPPIGLTLPLLDFDGDGDAIVGWDPRTGTPSESSRWPMLLEHVAPVVAEVSP
jgi:hypothetical protein